MSYEAWGDPEDSPFDAAIEAGWINPDDQTKALIDVMNERDRQVNEERFSLEQDNAYSSGELAAAAGCYALHAHDDISKKRYQSYPAWWPWSIKWWKPSDPRRNLVKAGALILAEIERLDRAEARKAGA